MAKSPRHAAKKAIPAGPDNPRRHVGQIIRSRYFLLGLGLLIAGYVVLTETDPAGQNWASRLSPILLVAGYILLGIAFWQADSPSDPQNPA